MERCLDWVGLICWASMTTLPHSFDVTVQPMPPEVAMYGGLHVSYAWVTDVE
jgi:hypothetical protein